MNVPPLRRHKPEWQILSRGAEPGVGTYEQMPEEEVMEYDTGDGYPAARPAAQPKKTRRGGMCNRGRSKKEDDLFSVPDMHDSWE